jgi:hypothetical protein
MPEDCLITTRLRTRGEGGPVTNEVDVRMVQLPERVTVEGREYAALIGGFKQLCQS